MELSKLLQIALRKKRMIFAYAVVTAACVFVIGLFLLKYEAKATLIIKPLAVETENVTIRTMLGMVSSTGIDILNTRGNSYINILESQKLIGKVIKRLELEKAFDTSLDNRTRLIEAIKQPLRFLFYGRLPAKKYTPFDKALKKLKREIKASFLVNSSIISLSVKDDDAQRSAAIANMLLDVFIDYSRMNNIKAAKRTITFIESQLDLTRERLKKQRDILKELKKEYGILVFSDFESEVTKTSGKLNRMEDQYESNVFNFEILKRKLDRIKKGIGKYPEFKQTTYTIDSNQTLLSLRNQLLNLKIETIELLIDFKPEAPQVRIVKNQIALIEKAINSELDRILKKQQFEVNPFYNTLTQEKFSIEAELAAIPILNEKMSKLIQKYRDRLTEIETVKITVSNIENSISKLKNKDSELIEVLSTAELVETRGPEEAQILDRASVPRYPVLRNVPLAIYVIIGFISGLILGTGWVVLKDQSTGKK